MILLLAEICIQPAYANSAQRHWRGTDSTGAVVTESSIVVDKELLTFDVQEFPNSIIRIRTVSRPYTGKVTAEYIFRIPPTMRSRPRWFSCPVSSTHYGEYIYDRATGRPVDVSDTLKYGVGRWMEPSRGDRSAHLEGTAQLFP